MSVTRPVHPTPHYTRNAFLTLRRVISSLVAPLLYLSPRQFQLLLVPDDFAPPCALRSRVSKWPGKPCRIGNIWVSTTCPGINSARSTRSTRSSCVTQRVLVTVVGRTESRFGANRGGRKAACAVWPTGLVRVALGGSSCWPQDHCQCWPRQQVRTCVSPARSTVASSSSSPSSASVPVTPGQRRMAT